MFEFRRKHGDQKWHMCQNCSEWPKSDYDTYIGKTVPQTDDTCWGCHGRGKCGGCDLKVAEQSGAKPDVEDKAR